MGSTTPLHALPYPASGDTFNVPVDVENLAIAVDNALPVLTTNGVAPASPVPGLLWYDTSTQLQQVWDGTEWRTVVGATGWLNIPLASGYTANGGLTPQYRDVNGVVYFRGQVAGSFTTSTVAISTALPSAYWPAGSGYAMATAVTNSSAITGRLYIPATSGILTVGFSASGATYVDLSALSYPLG